MKIFSGNPNPLSPLSNINKSTLFEIIQMYILIPLLYLVIPFLYHILETQSSLIGLTTNCKATLQDFFDPSWLYLICII